MLDSSWQRSWSKGFNALYLTNRIANHENAKISYCLDAGKEIKIIDAKEEPLCYAGAWLSPWACLSLVSGAPPVIFSQFLWPLPKQTVFPRKIFQMSGKGGCCVRKKSQCKTWQCSCFIRSTSEGQLCTIFSGTVVPFSFEWSWTRQRASGIFPCSLCAHWCFFAWKRCRNMLENAFRSLIHRRPWLGRQGKKEKKEGRKEGKYCLYYHLSNIHSK